MGVSSRNFLRDITAEKTHAQEKLIVPFVVGELSNVNLDFESRMFSILLERISILRPFLRDNNLILLDDPATHLSIPLMSLQTMMRTLKLSGVSLLVTSRNYFELERVCDRILFIERQGLDVSSLRSALASGFKVLFFHKKN